jgi:hypothetical protein
MASLDSTAALPALPDVDVELAVDGLARNLDLELFGDVGFIKGPPHSGQASGKGAS